MLLAFWALRLRFASNCVALHHAERSLEEPGWSFALHQ
jgi:hypothetical protein